VNNDGVTFPKHAESRPDFDEENLVNQKALFFLCRLPGGAWP